MPRGSAVVVAAGAGASAGAGGAGAGASSAAVAAAGPKPTAEASAGGEDGGWGVLASSKVAEHTHNPIRAIVDTIEKPKGDFINLSLGDPTVHGNLHPPPLFTEEVAKHALRREARGYRHSAGLPEARAAIAKRFSLPTAPLTLDDVIIGSGGSGALDLAISALANPGDNLLLPTPLFPLYETLAKSKGIESRYYRLLPEKNWEADLEQMEAQITPRTRAIMVNNPSNPCGNVMSKAHLLDILAIAERHHLPIIADEIYGNMTFKGVEFHPLASLTETVPVLTVGGLAKEFLAPGWRIGWVLVCDNKFGSFAEVRKGLFKLAMLILGANTLVQFAIPRLFDPQTEEDKEELATSLAAYVGAVEANALRGLERAREIPGLNPTTPQGALYTMVGIDLDMLADIDSDVDFAQKLLHEEKVFVLPGQCFKMPNYFRVVNCAPLDVMDKAFDAIARFCARHSSDASVIGADPT